MTACCVWNASNAAGGGGAAPTVSLSTADILNNSGDIGTCYANLQYHTDGTENTNSPDYSDNYNDTSRGSWLDSGSSSDVWFERTINSGSLWVDPGAGRLNLGTTRTLKVRDTNSGASAQSCNLDIEMWDAASGGSSLDSVAGLILRANYFDSCPLCCFTPDTLITMADGSTKAICEITEDDHIRTHDGYEKVTEVIVRKNRTMWELQTEDGRILRLSEDHPVYVEGKGYSSINPEPEYKDLTTTDTIVEGDFVMLESKVLLKVVSIKRYEYRHPVYTLGNSRFYANGILVY